MVQSRVVQSIQFILSKKDVTSVLSVVCWDDVSPRKDDITLAQVPPWIPCWYGSKGKIFINIWYINSCWGYKNFDIVTFLLGNVIANSITSFEKTHFSVFLTSIARAVRWINSSTETLIDGKVNVPVYFDFPRCWQRRVWCTCLNKRGMNNLVQCTLYHSQGPVQVGGQWWWTTTGPLQYYISDVVFPVLNKCSCISQQLLQHHSYNTMPLVFIQFMFFYLIQLL